MKPYLRGEGTRVVPTAEPLVGDIGICSVSAASIKLVTKSLSGHFFTLASRQDPEAAEARLRVGPAYA